jgi:hypothetical protein
MCCQVGPYSYALAIWLLSKAARPIPCVVTSGPTHTHRPSDYTVGLLCRSHMLLGRDQLILSDYPITQWRCSADPICSLFGTYWYSLAISILSQAALLIQCVAMSGPIYTLWLSDYSVKLIFRSQMMLGRDLHISSGYLSPQLGCTANLMVWLCGPYSCSLAICLLSKAALPIPCVARSGLLTNSGYLITL